RWGNDILKLMEIAYAVLWLARVINSISANIAQTNPFIGAGRPGIPLSGHGGHYDSWTVVPRGCSVTFFGEYGTALPNSLGQRIESGLQLALHEIPAGSRTALPGELIPNYTLFPPGNLELAGPTFTVSRPTQLSELLRPNGGNVNWAACQ